MMNLKQLESTFNCRYPKIESLIFNAVMCLNNADGMASSVESDPEIFQLVNVKMPIIVGVLTFMSRKNSILGLSESEKSRIS